MEYSIKENGSKVLLKIEEKMFDTIAAEELKKILYDLSDKGFNIIELDLSVVEYINSHWIGIILLFRNDLMEKGGTLNISSISEKMKGVFYMAGVEEILK